MIKRLITGVTFFFLTIIFLLAGIQGYGANRYSVATGNWNSTSTWSATSGGTAGATAPGAADNAFVEGGWTVTVNANASCTNVSIASGSTLSIGGFNFTVSGLTTVNGVITFTNTVGTKTMGNVTIAGGVWTSNAGETYGITALTLSGSTINGSSTGILNVGSNLSVTSGTTNTLNATTITVTGTSTIDGNLTFASTSGTKIFTGLTTITANGTWNNTINEAITFRGGLTNNGAFTAGTSSYTFDTNNQTISGTLSIPSITVTGVTLTNNGSLTVSTVLAGTGGLTQGSATSVLNIGGTSGITTLTASVSGNLVNFSGAAQTVNPVTYSNLTLSGSGTKTTTGITVNGVLSMEGTATLSVAPTYGTAATLQYNTATSRTAGVEWISPFTPTGGIIVTNTGTITMNSAENLSASVPLTINSGATLATANYQLTLGGNLNNSGTFSAGSSNIILTGTAATQNISGFTTTGTVSETKTSGTATFTGTVNGGALSVGAGATPLNLGTGLTHTFGTLSLGGNGQPSGSWGGTGSTATFINPTYFAASTGIANISTSSCTAGYWIGATNTDWNTASNWCSGTVPTASTNVVIPAGGNQPVVGAAALCNSLTINSGATLAISGSNTLTVSGNWTNNGTFTASSGTVIFNGAAQTVGTGPYNNLTLSGSGVKTITGVTVNGILSMEGTASASAAPTYGTNATLQYNKPGAFTAGPEWIANFSPTGGIVITNTGTITLNSAEVLNAPLTINSGASFSMSTFLLTLNSNLINNGGTASGTTGGVTIAGTATQSIGSFTTTGTVSMTKTAGTATLTGNINGAALTINGSGGTLSLDNGTALTHTFSGLWTQTAGTVNGNLSTLTVSTITNTGGTFNSNTGTVVFTGSATVPNLNYYNLTFTGTTTKTIATGVTISVANNWNVSSPATLTATAGATVTGSISGTGAITMGSGTITLAGDFTNTGTFTSGTGTVNYNGVTQQVMGNTYYNLTISNTGVKTTASATVTVNNNLTIAGSATFNLTYGVIGNATGIFSMAAGTNLIIGTSGSGNMLFPTNFTTANISLNSTSTVTYNSDTAVQTVSNTPAYGNLVIANSNSKSILLTATPTAINGYLQVNTGNTFALGAGTSGYAITITGNAIINGTLDFGGGGISKILNLTGNLSGSGSITQTTNIGHTLNLGGANNSIGSFVTFVGSGSTVNYNGAGSQQIFASPNYINLTVSGGGAKTLQGATSVGNILTLTSGILTTTTTNLLSVTNTATTAITGGSVTSFINGPVNWTLPASLVSGSTYTFPVGMGTTYLPFSLVNPTTSGTATAQVTAFAANPGGTFDATLVSISNSEYWALTTSGSFTNSSVSLTRPTAIAPLDAIGGSLSLTGPYTSLAGTTGTYGVTASNVVGTNTYFVLAGRKQTLTTGTITGSTFCAGAAVSVPYTITGTYTSGNIFTAQLSNASGSFTSPVTIGTLTQTSAGTISATIPTGTTPGTAYRIRVVSSTPVITGTDNGTNLTVSPGTAISSQSTSAQTQCINGSFTTISVTATGAGTLTYQWYSNTTASTTGGTSLGSANGAQTSIYTPQATSAGTLYYYCIVTGTCGSATSLVSGAFLVHPLPTITTTSPGSQCGNGTVTLGATASGTINWYAAATGGTSLGTGSTFTTPSLTSSTTYYVDVTSSGCVSAARTPVLATIIPNATLTIGGGGTFCSGTNITLTSTGTNVSNQYWVGPNNFYSVSANPVLSSATSAMSGTYKLWASGVSGSNLVYNGNFEAGNVGFTSGYGYVTPSSNALYPEGLYTVVANPSTVHPNFIACGDHTTGTGLQMVVNGAVTAGVNIWSQTVNVTPNSYYQFTYWIQSVTAGNPAQLQLYVNGVAAGPIYTADLATCSWEQFLYNWNSGSSTTAVLSLVNMNTIAGGNDFALDDIIFQQVCPATSTRSVGGGGGGGSGGSSSGVAYTDSVVVTVNAVVTAGVIGTTQSICSGVTPATLTSTTDGTGSGTITYQWQTNASGSYVTISGATASTYSPPPLTATTSYQRETVSVSGGITCYSPYTTPITITVSGPVANAGGPNTVCQSASPVPITLSGASFSGTGATSAAWSIVSGGGTLSSIAQTATPQNVTYTPAANYSGTVTLKLTTNPSGGCSGISSRTITITPSTIISAQSTGTQTQCIGGTFAAISVTATGTGTLTYQWYSNTTLSVSGGSSISGATNSSYIPSAATTGTLYYYCVVTGTCGTATSLISGAFIVTPATAISSQSTATQTQCIGGTFTAISITATGTGTLTYQWFSNATSSNSGGALITGATNSSYTPSAATAGTLYYYCVVSGTCASATSAVSGAFIVNPATAISSQSTAAQTQCIGGTFTPITVTATGTGSLTYQWYKNSTASTTGGTSLAAANGAQTNSYTPQATTAGTLYYYCIVSGSCSTATSAISGAFLVNPATAISSQSTNTQTQCIGGTFTPISVTATGTGSLSYQWYSSTTSSNSGGTAVSGATGSSYTPLATITGTLYYYCVVAGTCASATSAVSGAFIVNPATAISSQSTATQTQCIGGSFAAISVSATGTGALTYQWYSNVGSSNSGGTPITGATSSSYIPSAATAGTLYYYCVVTSTCASATSAVSGAFIVNPATAISSQSTGTQTQCIGGTFSAISVTATGVGLNYQWFSNTTSSNSNGTLLSGSTSSSYTPSAATAGTLYYYCVVNGTCASATSAVSGAFIVNPATSISSQSTATQTQCIGGTFAAISVTAAGTGPFYYQWYSNTSASNSSGAPITGATNSSYTPSAATAGTLYYYCVVTGTCASATSAVSGAFIVNPATAISSQSTATQTQCSGAAFTAISVTATGIGLYYQWYSNAAASNSGGNLISGAIASNYTPSSSTAGTLYYYCIVTGTCGSVTSAVSGAFIVNPATTISAQSTGAQTQCMGGSFTPITVTATGTGTLTYQWYSNASPTNSGGAPLGSANGAQTSNYTPQATTAGTLYYYCVVTGTCGTATSTVSGAFLVNPASVGGTISGGGTEFCQGGSTGTLTLSGYAGTIQGWQRQVNSLGWSNLGSYGVATYSETPYSGGIWQYRAMVQNGSCPLAYSSVVTIVVDSTTTVGTLGGGTTPICQGASLGTMTLSAGTGGVMRWEKQLNGGSWINITNTTRTYSEIPSSGGTWNYRVLVQSGGCSSLYSNIFTVVVNPTLTITLGANPVICLHNTVAQLSYTATTGSPSAYSITFDAAASSAGMASFSGYGLPASPIAINVPYSIAPGVYNGILSVGTTYPVCSSIGYPITVTVQDNTISATISGATTPCQGSSQTYTAATISGATYTWTFPSGWVQTGGGTTNTVTVTVGSGSGNIQVTPSFSCGNGTTQTLSVTPNLLPAATISYSGTPYCKTVSTAQAVTLTGTTGGTFTASPSGLTINSSTGAITPSSSTAGTYTITYTMTAAGGCGVVTATTSVTITTTPVATFSYTGSPYCSNAINPSPTFSGGGVAGTFSSTTGLVFVSTATGQINLASSTPGTYTVTNTIPAAGGCSVVTATSSITINPNLAVSVSIAPSSNPVCSSTSVTFTATPTNGGTSPTYQWSVNGSNTGTNSATYSYTPANGDVITCTLTSNAPCATGSPATSNTVTMTVNPNLPVSVTIAASANPVCPLTTVTYTATPTNGGTTPTYQWKVNGVNSGTNSATYTYSPLNSDAVTCVLTSNAPCATGSPATSNTVNMTVNSNLPVSVSIAASANPVCTSTLVTFTATPTNGGTAPIYQWKVNGVDAGTNSATYTYTPLNNDAVTCVLTSNATCATGSPATSNTVTMTVNPNLPVSVSIAASANPVCTSTPVTFTATPTNGGTAPTYQWKLNGVNVGTNSATYTYTPLNSDAVTCVLTSNATCATGSPATSNTVTMTVNPNLPVNVSIAASANPVCPSTAVTFTATPTNGGTAPTYQWKVNGTNAGTNSATYTYTPANTNAVTCVMTSNATCATGSPATSNTVTMTVNPNLPVSVSIAASANPVCTSTPVTFTATPTNGGTAPTYQWKLNGVNAGANSATYSYTPLNSDAVTCVLTSNATCATGSPATSNTVTMTVYPNPTVNAGSPMSAICQGGTSAALGGSFGGGATAAVWTAPSGTFSNNTGSTPDIATFTAAANSGTPITLTLTTSGGSCGTLVATKQIVVNPIPTVTIGSAVAAICQGGTTTALGGSFGGGATSAVWSDGGAGGTFTNNSGSTPATTTYTASSTSSSPVTLTLTTNGGSCGNTSSSILLTVNPNPTVNVGPVNAPICQGGTTAGLGGSFGGGAIAAVWSDGGAGGTFTNNSGTTPSATTYTASSSSSSPVTLTLTTSGGSCGTASASKQLTVNPNPTVNVGPSMATICQGGTTSVLGGSFGGGATAATWSDGGAGGTFTNNTGNTPGTTTYTASATFTNPVTLTLTTSGGSCGSVSANKQLTVTPTVTINPFSPATSTRCQGAGTVTNTTTASNSTGLSYTLDAASLSGGNSIVASTGVVTYSAGWSGTTTITASATGCNGPATTTFVETVTPTVGTPVFALGATSTRCRGGNSVTYTATATNNTGITYTLDSGSITGGNTIDSGTGTVTYIFGWSGTSIITATATGCNGPSTAVHTVTTIGDLVWTGSISTDWNTVGNWSCPYLPDLTTNVLIPNVTNQPILNSGANGMSNNIVINSGSSLTVTANTIQIAGSITNSGTFTASSGTIQMAGSAAQTIGAATFTGNTILNLTISNSAGVTLGGPLNVTGVVKAATGDLSSAGNLVLISTASQTALIDGSGANNVTGNVTMQRFLPSAFGYKYVSSPFQSAMVGGFGSYLNLAATFPSFYSYNENNSRDSLGVTAYQSGWVNYTTGTNLLAPMNGYAANFGTSGTPETISLTGVVNNGPLSVSLKNNNRKYTQGFNLVGNPYPSPINWNASAGWTKTNIDNAIYFFNADGTDQYTGVYSSYVNGTATGNGNNLIASMQGFFIHVSDGPYPVSGTLGMTNSVRTNDLAPTFRDATLDSRTILRFTANLETNSPLYDVALIYFDNQAGRSFNKELDALKMMNTDVLVPNLYTLSSDPKQLSIYAIPQPVDTTTRIPVGIMTLSDGWVDFSAKDISGLPSSLYIYLVDNQLGITQDLKKNPLYRFSLKAGTYNQRFSLVFSLTELNTVTPVAEKMFTLTRSASTYLITMNLPLNTSASLYVTNMKGQIIMLKEVFDQQTVEINPGSASGLYIVTVISGNHKQSEKILIR